MRIKPSQLSVLRLESMDQMAVRCLAGNQGASIHLVTPPHSTPEQNYPSSIVCLSGDDCKTKYQGHQVSDLGSFLAATNLEIDFDLSRAKELSPDEITRVLSIKVGDLIFRGEGIFLHVEMINNKEERWWKRSRQIDVYLGNSGQQICDRDVVFPQGSWSIKGLPSEVFAQE